MLARLVLDSVVLILEVAGFDERFDELCRRLLLKTLSCLWGRRLIQLASETLRNLCGLIDSHTIGFIIDSLYAAG